MTYERFETLADAYGGDLRRWPEAEREAARLLKETDPRAAALLADADRLDALLDAAPRAVASHALREQVLASAAAVWVAREKIEDRVAEARRPGRSESMWNVVEQASPAVREQVKHDLRANAMLARPDFDEARAARREAIALTGAETFDPVAVAALLERSRASEARGRSRLETGAVETLNRLSPEDRKALAPILSRHKAKRDARKPEKAEKPVAAAAAAPAVAAR